MAWGVYRLIPLAGLYAEILQWVGELGIFLKVQLQAASGGALEDNV